MDRATGEARWTVDDEVGRHAVATAAATREVVFVAYSVAAADAGHQGPARDRALRLLVLDAATGERRGMCEVPLDAPTYAPRLFPVDRGVVVVLERRAGRVATLVRVGA